MMQVVKNAKELNWLARFIPVSAQVFGVRVHWYQEPRIILIELEHGKTLLCDLIEFEASLLDRSTIALIFDLACHLMWLCVLNGQGGDDNAA